MYYDLVLLRSSAEITFGMCAVVKKLWVSSLGFTVQRDLQLYVAYKLAESLQDYPSLWEVEELFINALEPPSSLKYSERSIS